MDQKQKARIRASKWYYANKKRAKLTMQRWRKENAVIIKEQKRGYRLRNKRYEALRAKGYRENHPKETATQKREWYLKNKSRVFRNVKKNADPLKVRARAILYQAVKRGKVKKRPCKECGAIKVHAHHSDYRFPLKVVWLCVRHHYKRHQKLV